MKIRRFNESENLTFKHLKADDEKVYYKIQVNNSIKRLDVALNKLGLKKAFYRYYEFDINKFDYLIADGVVVYLHIVLTGGNLVFTISYNPMPSYTNNGEVMVEDYEVDAIKYNV